MEVPSNGGALEKAGRRKAAAQASLFDLANKKVIEEIREAPDSVSGEEAKELRLKLKKQLFIEGEAGSYLSGLWNSAFGLNNGT